MSIIYPGNYVAQLDAYRGQGVEAIPGVNFYSVIGVAMLEEDTSTPGSYVLGKLEVQSPDLRQDDKPRLNKALEVAAFGKAYQTSVSVVNVTGANAGTLTVTGGAAATVLTADAAGVFPAAGEISSDDLELSAPSTTVTASAVTVAATGALSPEVSGDQAYVIVQVCFWSLAPAPSSDNVRVPFKVEAGQGT